MATVTPEFPTRPSALISLVSNDLGPLGPERRDRRPTRLPSAWLARSDVPALPTVRPAGSVPG